MELLILVPFIVQLLVIGIDEFYFHVRRGLPKWERLGHPLDTLTVVACFIFVILVPYSSLALKIYIGLAVFSCVFVTKDEFVHKECCPASEQWLHALLFLNHPLVLIAAGLIWPIATGAGGPSWLSGLEEHTGILRDFMLGQALFALLFCCYQTIYWNLIWKDKAVE